MSLRKIELRSEPVELSDGQRVTLRCLTRAEALSLGEYAEDQSALEVKLVAISAQMDEGEVSGWYETAPAGDVQTLVQAALRLSGLDGELGKPPGGA